MKQVKLIIDDLFIDLETKDQRNKGDIWVTSKLRAEYLKGLGYVEIL